MLVMMIIGDTFRPDLILHNKRSKKVHMLEPAVGFESNLKVNSARKLIKYKPLITSLSPSYQKVNFINISMSALGILDKSYVYLFKLLKDLDLPQIHQKSLVSKIITIPIRSTYFAAETKIGQIQILWTSNFLFFALVLFLSLFFTFTHRYALHVLFFLSNVKQPILYCLFLVRYSIV